MTEGLADARNRATERHVTLYRRWAEGGAALLLTGELDEAPDVEKTLRIGPGIFGPNSPIAMMKAVNGFARIGWFYEQIYRLADELEADVSMGALRALMAYEKTEKTKARELLR